MLETLYSWYGKRTVWTVGGIILALGAAGAIISMTRSDATAEPVTTKPPQVAVATVATLVGSPSLSLIGTVEAIDQARITSEVGGRVVAVSATLGQPINAGTVVVQLENASERAAVLQAEGSYEAAVAAAAQSSVGVGESEGALQIARNNLAATQNDILTLYRSSFTTAQQIIRETADQFYSSPDFGITGLRISGRGNTQQLVDERRDWREILPTWQNDSVAADPVADVATNLENTTAYTARLITMVDLFLETLPREDPNAIFTEAVLAAAITDFSQARTSLVGILDQARSLETALQNATESVRNAEQALTRAEIGGGENGQATAADAQIKQALGALRAAEANLAKTSIRTPIAGTVNKIDVKTGDFVTSFQEVATVANNEALEVTVFVGAQDLPTLSVGTEVMIDGKNSGRISAIAPAIDPSTGKAEVKITTESDALTTGDTVTVTLDTATSTPVGAQPLLVPITAVKFAAANGTVFTVAADGKLVAVPVVIGSVVGAYVTVLEGLDATMEIVVDARGLAVGQTVEATRP